MPAIDLLGKRFGRLIVRARNDSSPAGQARWLCDCDCGNQTTVASQGLRRIEGPTRSCGCLKREVIFPNGRKIAREANTRHGHGGRQNRTPTYRSWYAMIARCTNQNFKQFKDYGGRGITVCERWRQSFEAFLADMGDRPQGQTLDRVNGDGNYEPTNCRWATRSEQDKNRRPRIG